MERIVGTCGLWAHWKNHLGNKIAWKERLHRDEMNDLMRWEPRNFFVRDPFKLYLEVHESTPRGKQHETKRAWSEQESLTRWEIYERNAWIFWDIFWTPEKKWERWKIKRGLDENFDMEKHLNKRKGYDQHRKLELSPPGRKKNEEWWLWAPEHLHKGIIG